MPESQPVRSVVASLGDPERVLAVVFGCRPAEVAEDVVLTPFVPLKAFRRHVDEVERELTPPFFYKGFTARRGARRVTVLATGVGPGRVGDCVGFLSLTPARRIVFAGAVGGLRDEHGIGDFFLPDDAADGEGYTRYAASSFEQVARAAPRVPAGGALGDGLAEPLAAAGLRVHRGAVFSIGCITCESADNLNTLRALGFAAIEMELAAFFAALGLHGIPGAAITYVSDLPLRSSLWAPKSPAEQDALRGAYRRLPELALDYLTPR